MNVKQRMVTASERDTALIFRTLRNTSRVFRNSVAQQVLEIESRPGDTDFEEIAPLVKGTRGRDLFATGDLDSGVWSAGMAMGLIDDIPTCDELVSRIVAEAEAIIRERLSALSEP